jgi:hypothetical protein
MEKKIDLFLHFLLAVGSCLIVLSICLMEGDMKDPWKVGDMVHYCLVSSLKNRINFSIELLWKPEISYVKVLWILSLYSQENFVTEWNQWFADIAI